MMNNSKVVVVIPRYREQLNICEQVSLRQVQFILAKYDIVFVSPSKMKYFYSGNDAVEFFPDECFETRYGYSELLMTTDFYARFDKYEYLLIYQLDAYVFQDKLDYYCSLGYDYIGAPLNKNFSKITGGRVGNGGFSLRKISSCIRMTNCRNHIIGEVFANIPDDGIHIRAEDRFFSWCGYNKNYDFRVPDIKTAVGFALECDVQHAYKRLNENNLPFGVHAWSKSLFFSRWKDYIKQSYGCQGVDMRLIEECVYKKNIGDYMYFISYNIMPYLYQRFLSNSVNIQLTKTLTKGDSYFIWGNGIVGNRLINILTELGYNVSGIVDKKVTQPQRGKYCLYPVEYVELLCNRGKFIVAVKDAVIEISGILNGYGLKKNRDYFLYTDIEQEFVFEYLKKFR